MKQITTKYTYKQLTTDLVRMADYIPSDGWTPTMILGVSRGGLIPAVMLSHFFNIPLYPYHISLRDHIRVAPVNADLVRNQHLLVVDDICDTGRVLDTIYEKIEPFTKNIRSFTLHYKPTQTNHMPYFFCNVIDANVWIEYPWENWWKSD